MLALMWIVLAALALPFKSKGGLEAENAILRQQIIVLRRQVHGRVKLTNFEPFWCNFIVGFRGSCGGS